MQDKSDYAEDVLKIVKDQKQRVMSELRVELFMAAAHSSNAEASLMPFPHCFFDKVKKQKLMADLLVHLKDIPALKDLDFVGEKLPEKTWELLYWILTNPLTIQHVETNQETLCAWTQETGLNLDTLFTPGSPAYFFNIVNPNLKPEFVKGKAEYGTLFAFHGSKLENFHSIVHRGLLSALNVRSAYGHGSYLSNSYNNSFAYTDFKRSWTNSGLGLNVKCMAICEVVKYPGMKINGKNASTSTPVDHQAPNETTRSCDVYVVDKDEYIQLSHLVLLTGCEQFPRVPTGDTLKYGHHWDWGSIDAIPFLTKMGE